MRANERFSGRGHARHVCRDCSKLGKEELAYRQAARDIDRLLDWDGMIRRRQRASFERFISHPDERIRLYARDVAARDLQARESLRQEHLLDDAEDAAWEEGRPAEDDGDAGDQPVDPPDRPGDKLDRRASESRGTARERARWR
jgi:hypothetical protein